MLITFGSFQDSLGRTPGGRGKRARVSKSQSLCRGDGARGLEIFPSPKAYIGGEGGDLGIFPSLKASMEVVKSRSYIGGGPKTSTEGKPRNFSKSQSLCRRGEGELSIFPRPKASIEGKSSEFFQVPELICGGG